MRAGAGLLGAAVLLLGPCRLALLRSGWLGAVPRAGIAVWQSYAAAVAAAVVGAAAAGLALPFGGPTALGRALAALTSVSSSSSTLTPNELFALTAGLIVTVLVVGAVGARTLGVLRTRAHHRMLIDLVATPTTRVPGAVLVDHEVACAYCVPGRRARIVVSSGTLDVLSPAELSAVVDHERAHVHARHHLVVLPFVVLASLVTRSRLLGGVRDEVRLLVEMAADDRALRRCRGTDLAGALVRLTTVDAGPLALGAVGEVGAEGAMGTPVARRIERALVGRRGAPVRATAAGMVAAGLLALPALSVLAARAWG